MDFCTVAGRTTYSGSEAMILPNSRKYAFGTKRQSHKRREGYVCEADETVISREAKSGTDMGCGEDSPYGFGKYERLCGHKDMFLSSRVEKSVRLLRRRGSAASDEKE